MHSIKSKVIVNVNVARFDIHHSPGNDSILYNVSCLGIINFLKLEYKANEIIQFSVFSEKVLLITFSLVQNVKEELFIRKFVYASLLKVLPWGTMTCARCVP